MNLIRLAFISLLSFTAAATAQVTFTIEAVHDGGSNAQLGYAQGGTYTFVFTTGSSFGNNSSSFFNNSTYYWSEYAPADDQLWSTISGTGLGGSFAASSSSMSSAIYLTSANGLKLSASDLPSLGLTTPLGGFAIKTVGISKSTLTSPFSFSGSYTDPVGYFDLVSGTYQLSTVATPFPTNEFGVTLAAGDQLTFRITSVTISASAVPEPAATALWGGAAILGMAMILRHRRRQSARR